MKKDDVLNILTAMKKSYLSLGIPDPEAVEALERAINAVKAEPCEDVISRDDVYGILMRTYFRDGCSYEEFKERLEQILPVTSQPKTGHWIFDEILDKHYYCSECKSMGVDYWDFCPYCGAKMVEPQESEEV